MVKKYILMLIIVLFARDLWANELSFKGRVVLSDTTNTDVLVTVAFSWENSWCGNYNHDAAWLFFKYRLSSDMVWRSLPISSSVSVSDTNYLVLQPDKVDGRSAGAMVYRKKEGSGSNDLAFSFRWTYPAGVTRELIRARGVTLMAHGIEMVYIPWGPYILGDGVSERGFVQADASAVPITSEDSLRVNTGTADISLPSAYPKGYQGFYLMKYEVTQEQYVAFLNSLTLSQQKELLGNGLVALSAGSYVFGGGSAPSFRNGIMVRQPSIGGRAVVFSCDQDGTNTGKGNSLACNYLSARDLLGYASWSGLRPMSELEYEKACRQMGQDSVTGGEYAWGNTSAVSMRGLEAGTEGSGDERPLNGNVNGGGVFSEGPVRVGAFAALAATREEVGAGFGGVMELSGNVGELCIGVDASSFDKNIHGTGEYAPSLWSGLVAGGFGLRGGSFQSPVSVLRVSDRSGMGTVSSLDDRSSGAGFRVLRMLSPHDFIFDPGSITFHADTVSTTPIVSATLCVGTSFRIDSLRPAVIKGMEQVAIRYEWYCNDTLITGATGTSVNYPGGLAEAGIYRYYRRAVCYMGYANSDTVTVTVHGTPSIEELTLPLFLCTGTELKEGVNIDAPVIHANGSPVVKKGWLLGGVPVMENGSGYVVKYDDRLKDIRYYALNACSPVAPGGEETAVFCGKRWMVQNLNDASKGGTCYDNNAANCATYGRLYSWNEAMVACPAGWHLPSREEYEALTGCFNKEKWSPQYAGHRHFNNNYYTLDTSGFWWSSTESGRGWFVSMYPADTVIRGGNWYEKAYNLSVRCVKD